PGRRTRRRQAAPARPGRVQLSWFLLLRGVRIERTPGGALQLGARDPVVTNRLEVAPVAFDLLSPGLQKLEDAEQHRVVAKLRLLDGLLPQRQEDGAVMLGRPVSDDEAIWHGAHRGAEVERQVGPTRTGLPDRGQSSRR